MIADTEIRIIAKLLEEKTQLQEKALRPSTTSRVKFLLQKEIEGIDTAIKIVKREFENEEKSQKELLESLKKRSPKSSCDWIPATRALPTQDGMYLVTLDDGFVTATEYCDNEWQLWADSGNVIAWQKVPKAYKEG